MGGGQTRGEKGPKTPSPWKRGKREFRLRGFEAPSCAVAEPSRAEKALA